MAVPSEPYPDQVGQAHLKPPWSGATIIVFEPTRTAHRIVEYALLSGGRRIAEMLQLRPKRLWRAVNPTLTTYAHATVDREGRRAILVNRGPMLGRVRIVVRASDGSILGYIVAQSWRRSRTFRVNGNGGEHLAVIRAEGRLGRVLEWSASMPTPISEEVVAQLTSTTEGVLPPIPIRYVLSLSDRVGEPLASLLIAAVIGLHTAHNYP